MDINKFIQEILNHQPDIITEKYLKAETVTAFPTASIYENYKDKVRSHIPGVEEVHLVGTGNWRFSLNPNKNFKEFDNSSDIDIAVISYDRFNETWEELRRVHRLHWYTLPGKIKDKINRNALDIYAGFISPDWIPGPVCSLRYQFKRILNRLSDESVNYKKVKILFFKN